MNIIKVTNNNFIDGSNDSVNSIGLRGLFLNGLARISVPACPWYVINSDTFKNIEKEYNAETIKKVTLDLWETFNKTRFPLTLKVFLSPSIRIDVEKSVHNIGLNNQNIKMFSKRFIDSFFGYQEYCRLMYSFATRFLGYSDEDIRCKQDGENWEKYLQYLLETVKDFPQDKFQQLEIAIKGLYREYYSDDNNEDVPCALIVQPLVYGNVAGESYSGFFYTRNYVTGEQPIKGKFVKNTFDLGVGKDMEDILSIPEPYLKSFLDIADKLEKAFIDIRRVKFTIEEGKIWLIEHTDVGNSSSCAVLKLFLDLYNRKIIDKDYVIQNFRVDELRSLMHPHIDEQSVVNVGCLSGGVLGSPGAAVGRVFFTSEKLIDKYKEAIINGRDSRFILAMPSTYAEDVEAIELSQGVISTEGGYASHAPVVARSLGKCACVNPDFIMEADCLKYKEILIKEGDYVSISAPYHEEPKIFIGEVSLTFPDTKNNGVEELITLLNEYNQFCEVKANGDTVKDLIVAKKFGAAGVGLCRTEHMFFGEEKLFAFRALLLSDNAEQRKIFLQEISHFQKQNFIDMAKVLDGDTFCIRFLDSPLHEFIPKEEEEIEKTYNYCKKFYNNITHDEFVRRCEKLREVNPMLGHRGCRMAISYPDIYEMQFSAFLEAMHTVHQEGYKVKPEVMIPLVMGGEEMEFIIYGKNVEDEIILGLKGVEKKLLEKLEIDSFSFDYKLGVMVELPSACINAGQLAKNAQFFSFGTNDLTQTTCGISRDDINSFYSAYNKYDILENNIFLHLTDAVKELMLMAIERGDLVRPDLRVGLCGEHSVEEENIKFCLDNKFDYISCSVYSIPIVKLAVAKYIVENK